MALNDIEVFRFPETGQPIRTVMQDGEPEFVAADALAILGLDRTAYRRLDDDEKGVARIHTPGGEQEVTTVTEPGLYSLILGSRKTEAKKFKRWVTHDVLPALRKTGRYAIEQRFQLPQTFADALQLAADQAREIEQQGQEIEQQGRAIAVLTPKAEQADHYRAASGLTAIATFANDLQQWAREQCGVDILHKDVRDYMAYLGLLIRTPGIRKNEPTADAIKRGLLRINHTTYEHKDGTEGSSSSARLTQRGCGYVWDRAVRRIRETGSLELPKKHHDSEGREDAA